MHMSPQESPVRRLVAQQAADWYVACQEGLDAVQAADFASWLRASPLHVHEYLALAQLAGDLRAATGSPLASVESLVLAARFSPEPIEPLRELPVQARAPEPQAERPAPAARLRWAALAAAACLAGVVVAWLWEPSPLVTHHATARGQHLTNALPDASQLTLDADSAVDVSYTAGERHVALVRGQALFQVAHDVSRPFRVQAGGVTVTAVGTAFDVDRRAEATLVTVTEGRVQVTLAGETRPLSAGQQMRISGDRLGDPVAIDTARATAWLQGQIYFDEEPLAQVAAEVSRYADLPIDVLGERLRALPISGAVTARDTAGFLAFVRGLEGVRVREGGDRIVVEAATP